MKCNLRQICFWCLQTFQIVVVNQHRMVMSRFFLFKKYLYRIQSRKDMINHHYFVSVGNIMELKQDGFTLIQWNQNILNTDCFQGRGYIEELWSVDWVQQAPPAVG